MDASRPLALRNDASMVDDEEEDKGDVRDDDACRYDRSGKGNLTGNVRRVEAMTGAVTRFNTRHAQTYRLFVLSASNMSHKRRAPEDDSSEIASVDNSASEEEPEFHVGKHHKSSILHLLKGP